MKKTIKYIIFSILVIFLVKSEVHAGSLSLVSSTNSVTIGNNVIITVKGSEIAGRFSLTSSNGSVLSGGASSFWLENETKTYTFKSNSVGTATITLTPIDVSDYDGNAYKGSKSVTINVKAKPVVVLSSDSSLSSISIGDYKLEPEFNKDIREYSVTLPPETTSVDLVATSSHSGANISGNGTREVTDGDNKLEIIVTAENGTQSVYTVNAKVEEYNPIIVKINNDEYTVVRKKSLLEAPNNYSETSIQLNEENIPAFYSEITKYTLVALKDKNGNQQFYKYEDGKYSLYQEFGFNKIVLSPLELEESKIPKNYHKTTITYNDIKLTAYKIKNTSKYALIYGMNVETGEKHIYTHDSKEDTLQVYNDEEIELLKEKIKLLFYLCIGFTVLIFILFIVIINMLTKRNKPKKDAKLIEDIIIEKNINEQEEMKRKELSKKELRKKAKRDKKAIKKEKKKKGNSEEEIKVEKIDLSKY